jgi:hypothetical protein
MTFQSTAFETRLQRALRALAESQGLVDQHNADLAKLIEAGHCVRAATAINCQLRERLAQCRRDVIWARYRIRFGLDDVSVEPVSLQLPGTTQIEHRQEVAIMSQGIVA